MAKERLPVQTSWRVLDVSESGFYEWRNRPLLGTFIATCLADAADHRGSHRLRGTYGAQRIHAEITLGDGIVVGRGCIELLMRAAGVKGLPRKTEAPRTLSCG